jgi:integrase
MRVKFTERFLKQLKPTGEMYEAHDLELKGLRIRVMPSGVKSFAILYRNAEGRQIRYTVGQWGRITLKQARELAKEALGAVASGDDPQETKRQMRKAVVMPTMQQFLDGDYGNWVTANRKDGKATMARLKACFKADLITKKLNTITAWQVDKWVSGRRKAGRQAATINRDLTALKAMLAKAVEWDLLEVHPLTKVKPLKVDKHSCTRYLKPAEETALRQALDIRDRTLKQERTSANAWRRKRGYTVRPEFDGFADHMKPMVLVSLNTGIRRGELFQLRWSDVDLKQRLLTVRGSTAKSASTRHVPLNDEAVNVLTTWKGKDANPLVFPGRNGEAFTTIKKAWAGLLTAAKIKDFRWHDLRHTFASKLVMAGVDLNTCRELLGHSDIKMTLRYAHLGAEHKADAVGRLMR